MLEVQIKDMSTPLNQIKAKHGPRYHLKKEAFAEAASLWGFQHYNDCGVVPSQAKTILNFDSYRAELCLAESTKGYWLMSFSAHTSISVTGSCPSVFDSEGYHSREDAITAGTEQIKRFYQRELSQQKSTASSSQRIAIEKALKLIDLSQNQPEFDFLALPQTGGGSHAR
jgi:hypothetical protein